MWFFGELIETRWHQFHTNPYICVGYKTTETLYNVWAIVRFKHHINIHNNSFLFFRVVCSSHLLQWNNWEFQCELAHSAEESNQTCGSSLSVGRRRKQKWWITLTAINLLVGLCLILTTWPLVPLPNSPKSSKSLISVLCSALSIVIMPCRFIICSNFRDVSGSSGFRRRCGNCGMPKIGGFRPFDLSSGKKFEKKISKFPN